MAKTRIERVYAVFFTSEERHTTDTLTLEIPKGHLPRNQTSKAQDNFRSWLLIQIRTHYPEACQVRWRLL